MQGEEGNKELEERIQLLKAFLESADFKKLRSQSEKYLLEGRSVKFIIYWKDEKTKLRNGSNLAS